MTIVIVGGSGFIGTRLAKRFLRSDVPFSIVDKAVSAVFPDRTTVVDIRERGALAEALTKAQTIINLAAEHRDDVTPKSLYKDVNVGGAKNVCEVAEAQDIKTIIFTSSVAVYGFAPVGTDESGAFNPFNDYGRTKLEAEYIYKEWQAKDPLSRSLVIIRPTVVFGEGNRGNVYNLLRQIASGKFVMIGAGKNFKSMAYVENIAAFIEHSLTLGPGLHIYNYVDKPDFDMNTLIKIVYKVMGKEPSKVRLPYIMGMATGKCFDFAAALTGKKFPISSIRVKKFCSDTKFDTSVAESNFSPPVTLQAALEQTVRYEFVDDNRGKEVFFTE